MPGADGPGGLRHGDETDLMDETFPDIGAMNDQELKEMIDQLTKDEQEVSYQRRMLHGKIDILRAELVNRLRTNREDGDALISGADVEKLTDILAGRVTEDDGDR